jgi:hypothetical protein
MGEIVKRSFLRWLSVSATLGLIVPIVILLAEKIVFSNTKLTYHYYYFFYLVLRFAWPPSIALMATDGNEGTPSAYLIVAISILANILLYSVLGCILWGVSRAIIKARGKIQSS